MIHFFAFFRVGSELGFKKLAAVEERKRVTDSDHATPGAFTDQLTESKGLKAVRKNIAVRRRKLIDETHHRSEERLRRIRLWNPVPCHLDHDECVPQSLDDER